MRAIRAVVPGFTGPFTDPPPLPFQLRDPARLRRELTDAGLQDISVVTITESLEFPSGGQLWSWLTSSNPIVGMLLDELSLTGAQAGVVQKALDTQVQERAAGRAAAILTNPINIGIGVK